MCPLERALPRALAPFAAAGRSPDGRWEDLACLRPPPPSSRDPGRGSEPLGFPAPVLREGPGLRARRPATARAHAPAASPWVQDWAAPARALVQAPRLSAPQPPAPVESWGGTEAPCSSKCPLAVSSPGLANAPVRSGARRDWRCSLRANGTRAKLVGRLGHAMEVGAAPKGPGRPRRKLHSPRPGREWRAADKGMYIWKGSGPRLESGFLWRGSRLGRAFWRGFPVVPLFSGSAGRGERGAAPGLGRGLYRRLRGLHCGVGPGG